MRLERDTLESTKRKTPAARHVRNTIRSEAKDSFAMILDPPLLTWAALIVERLDLLAVLVSGAA